MSMRLNKLDRIRRNFETSSGLNLNFLLFFEVRIRIFDFFKTRISIFEVRIRIFEAKI